MFTLCFNTNANKDRLQYQSSSSLSTVSKNSHNHWIISTQQRLYQSSSSLSLVVPVQVATTVVAMNTDHPEWILPITVDYLFESPQGKKSCNSFIFLSWSLWSSSSFLLSILRYRHHYHRHHHCHHHLIIIITTYSQRSLWNYINIIMARLWRISISMSSLDRVLFNWYLYIYALLTDGFSVMRTVFMIQ